MRWKLFETISIGGLLALSLNLIIIFSLGYITGRPVLIHINAFTEGHIEAILFPVFFIIGVITLIRMIKREY